MAERRRGADGPGGSGPGRGRDQDLDPGRRRGRAPATSTTSGAEVEPETRQVPAQVGAAAEDEKPATAVRGSRGRSGHRPPRRPRPSAEERNRRRFVRRQWTRRWLAWRAVLVALVLLALGGLAGWVVLVSDVLGVDDVEVTGTQLLGERQVAAAAAVPGGEPLARVDLDAIERRVESLAEVRDATATRDWPHDVSLRVTERQAIAVVAMSGQLRGMDDQGVLFRDFGRAPAGLPRVDMPWGTRSEAMVEAARVIESLPPDLVSQVDHVEVGSMDAISLVLRGGRRIVWGSAEESDAKAEVVDALLGAVPAQVYDVSVPGQPTTAQ